MLNMTLNILSAKNALCLVNISKTSFFILWIIEIEGKIFSSNSQNKKRFFNWGDQLWNENVYFQRENQWILKELIERWKQFAKVNENQLILCASKSTIWNISFPTNGNDFKSNTWNTDRFFQCFPVAVSYHSWSDWRSENHNWRKKSFHFLIFQKLW